MLKEKKNNPNPRESKKIDAILGAGQTLFAQSGYKKTTVDEIARVGNVAKGTIYNYFDSKDDILAEVVHREANQIIYSMEDAVNRESDPIDKIRAFILIRTTEIKKTVNSYRISREIAYELWPLMDKVRADYLDWERELLTKIFKQGIKSGQFKIKQPEMVANVTTTVLKALELKWVLEREHHQIQDEIDLLMEVMLWGIVGRE